MKNLILIVPVALFIICVFFNRKFVEYTNFYQERIFGKRLNTNVLRGLSYFIGILAAAVGYLVAQQL